MLIKTVITIVIIKAIIVTLIIKVVALIIITILIILTIIAIISIPIALIVFPCISHDFSIFDPGDALPFLRLLYEPLFFAQLVGILQELREAKKKLSKELQQAQRQLTKSEQEALRDASMRHARRFFLGWLVCSEATGD